MKKFLKLTNQKKRTRVLWYLKRFRTMSVQEVGYRVKNSLKKKLDNWNKAEFCPSGKISEYPKPILYLPEITHPITLKEYSIFGITLPIDETINWHLDITNNTEFPKDFSFSIDTRTGKNGNVKVVWEINRLQFLSAICLQYDHSQDSKYLDQFMNIIISWKDANPYLRGVNWYSNIEVNLRILNWFLCWEILQVDNLVLQNKKFKDFVEKIWLPLIELHGMHSARYESKYSSSNNHLIAEASGLFVVGSYWSFKESPKWRKKGKNILEKEIKRQHSAEGINKEEASEYIQFITDFFLIPYIVGQRTGDNFSATFKNTLKNIFEYIFHLMDISGNVPYYGDDDDGKVFWLDFNHSVNNFQSLLTSGAILFNDSRFKSKGTIFDLKNQILFGPEGAEKFNKIRTQEKPLETKIYKNEGHFFIKKGDSKREIYLHVDIAPLGYLSIAAHGHADALSFFLNIDGKPYIIDPGTYTYHSHPEWREYFKGTIAHNTVRVDGLNQSTNGGPCLWLDHYSAKLLYLDDKNKNKIELKGRHNGYEKLGITHIRSYTFDKEKDLITILDEISSEADTIHRYEVPIHLHPNIELSQLSAHQFEICHPGHRTVRIVIDENLTSTLVNGAENPILGWYSPSFLRKQPTTVIYSTIEAKGNFKLKTKIAVISKPVIHEA